MTTQRRPLASQTARPKRARVPSMKTQARPWRIFVTVRALSSCCESATWSWPKPGFRTPFSSPVWIACLACFFRPIRSASWKMIGRRSSTTWPFWLETTVVVPLQDRDQLGVGDPVGLLPEHLNPWRLEGLLRGLGRELTDSGRRRRGDRLEVLGQSLLQVRRDVDVRVELIDGVVRERVRDLLVLEQLAAGVDPLVRVERLAVDPAGEDRQEGEDRGGMTRMRTLTRCRISGG